MATRWTCATTTAKPIRDDTFLLLLNAHHEPVNFVLPGQEDVRWELIIDTRNEEGFLEKPKAFAAADEHPLEARSFCLFRLAVGEQAHARSDSWRRRAEKSSPPPPARAKKARSK